MNELQPIRLVSYLGTYYTRRGSIARGSPSASAAAAGRASVGGRPALRPSPSAACSNLHRKQYRGVCT